MMNIITGSYPIQTSSVPGANVAQQKSGSSSFRDILNGALDNIRDTHEVKQANAEALAIGDVDDLAALAIDDQRAEVAIQLLVQVRNQLVEAYQEVMRLNV